jgi:hypothetical protein
MSRIFVGLASLNTLALLASFAVGLAAEGRVNVHQGVPLTDAQRLFTLHLLGGLFAALLTLLVHCLVFTYFMGTGRWVQEVVAAYGLPESQWLQARRLKTRTLPLVIGSILLVIATAMLGAAADVGTLDGTYHLLAAAVAIAFNLWSYPQEYRAIRCNSILLDEIMAEVKRMRLQRGLA